MRTRGREKERKRTKAGETERVEKHRKMRRRKK